MLLNACYTLLVSLFLGIKPFNPARMIFNLVVGRRLCALSIVTRSA